MMFPGGGAQYVGMARDLYETNGFFRHQVEACFELLEKKHNLNIRETVFPQSAIQNPQSEIRTHPVA